MKSNSLFLNLQLEQLLEGIKKQKAKSVLVQLPDGLKPKALEIQALVKKVYPEVKLTFWAGSCYGACDLPNVKGFDLAIQFGHSEWK